MLQMAPVVVLVVIVFLAVGYMVGCHAMRAKMAHADIKAAKGRVSVGRRTRLRSGLFVVALIGISILVLSALVRT
jgi:hypothetical protein